MALAGSPKPDEAGELGAVHCDGSAPQSDVPDVEADDEVWHAGVAPAQRGGGKVERIGKRFQVGQ